MSRGVVGRLAPARARRWFRPALVALFAVSVVALLLSIVTQSPSGAPTKPVMMATSDWAPYVSSSLPDGGPAAVMVAEVLGRSGYAADLSFGSWAQVDSKVARGSAAAAFPLVASAERRAAYLVSEPLMSFDYVLFYPRTEGGTVPRVDTGADLATFRIGTVAGYDYWDEFEDNASDVVEYDNSLQAFEGMRRGEVDLVAEGLVSGTATLNSPEFSGSSGDFEPLPVDNRFVRSRETLHLLAARTDAGRELIERFDTELEAYQESGDYARLVEGMQAPLSSAVVLASTDPRSTLIQLFRGGGSPQAVTPAGTTALVLSWPETASTTESAAGQLVRIKITSGPQAGRVALVPYGSIELAGATG